MAEAVVEGVARPRQRRGFRIPNSLRRNLRDAPLWTLVAAGTVAIEGYGAIYALDSAVHEHMIATPFGPAPMMGVINAALVLTCATMASFLLYRASQRRGDARAAVRKTALTPAIVGVALMTWPMVQFASGLAWERQKAQYAAYHGSKAEATDDRTANDSMADLGERAAAREALKKSVRPSRADPTFAEWVGCVLLYGFWSLAAGAGRAVEPETPSERQRRERREERHRAETRRQEREKAERDAQRTAALLAGIPFIGKAMRGKYPPFLSPDAHRAA